MQRTQIYLEDEQQDRLAARARRTGRTKSDLIREAIDAYLDEGLDTQEELDAFRAVIELGAGSIERLPSGAEYVRDLRQADRARDERLEERWKAS